MSICGRYFKIAHKPGSDWVARLEIMSSGPRGPLGAIGLVTRGTPILGGRNWKVQNLKV
jgi:hypothetical protein